MSKADAGLFGGPGDMAVPARPNSPPQIDAARIARPKAQSQAWRIVRALQMLGPMTREEICNVTGIPTCAACGRLAELENPQRCRHVMLATPPLVKKAGRKRARSGVRVWLYDLTTEGKAI